MLSKQAQVKRVKDYFGTHAANMVKAILNNDFADDGTEIAITTDAGITVRLECAPEGSGKAITVKAGIAQAVYIEGREPIYNFVDKDGE